MEEEEEEENMCDGAIYADPGRRSRCLPKGVISGVCIEWGFLSGGYNQWSNYGGARGGLAHPKDLAAPAKYLF